MSNINESHECDLFLLSSHSKYFADSILSEFAIHGKRNIHGWGIGSYADNRAKVFKSERPAIENDGTHNQVSREFSMAIQAVSSPTILGHLRLTSSGSTTAENNHPFKLPFLGYDWMLVHNGTATNHQNLVPFNERLLIESDNDTARVFEFLRKQIIDYYFRTAKTSLIEACRHAYAKLLNENDHGKFNIILTNGKLSFVFIHWRPFFLLNREKDPGDTVLITTIENLTDDEEWLEIDKLSSKKAKMLVFSGHSLIFNGDIPK